MNSSLTEAGPSNSQEEKSMESNEPPATKEPAQSENEKDSGYSDSSSESLSLEDTSSTPASVIVATPNTPQSQTTYASIYILQNIVLKEPRIIIRPPLRSHRKRTSPSSYLPILRSYPRIAPRLAPLSDTSDAPKEPEPTPPPSKMCKQTAPQLLEVSLRSLALLRRTRETQRSIRELMAHARLYERALQGEEGGWERLRKAMETSGGYRKIPPAIDSRTEESATNAADSIPTEDDKTAPVLKLETQTDEIVTSPGKSVTSTDSALSDGDMEGYSMTGPAPLVFVHFDFYNTP